MQAAIGAAVAVLLMLGFLALDKQVLHWYYQADSANDIARVVLAEWDRNIPESQRAMDNFRPLRLSPYAPEEGSANQLSAALIRIANVAALPLLNINLSNLDERDALDLLNQCVEFLLATTDSTISCGLAPISR